MHIIKTPLLSQGQKNELRELEKLCQAHDGLHNSVYLESDLKFDPEFCGFFLGYEGDVLAAALVVFAPERAEGEIMAYTRPELRRQGRFWELYAQATAELERFGVGRKLIVSEPPNPALAAFDAPELLRTEYRMSADKTCACAPMAGLKIVPASRENAAEFARINGEGFSEIEGRDSYIESVLTSPDCEGWLAMLDGEPAGVYSLNNEESRAFIYGLAVAKNKRRRGIGRQLVCHGLEHGLGLAPLVALDVDSDNAGAFELYKSCGFKTEIAVEYHRV